MKNMTAVIIRRSNDENTVAIVKALVDPEMVESVNDLFGAVSQAVTQWSTTKNAKRLLQDTGGDINIGDLANEGIDNRLNILLKAVGVHELDIQPHVGEVTAWDYDDNLVVDQ